MVDLRLIKVIVLITQVASCSSSFSQTYGGDGGKGGDASVQVIIIPRAGYGGQGGNAYGNSSQHKTLVTNSCVIDDPTPTPLNLRATPSGQVVGTVINGTRAVLNSVKYDVHGKGWADIITIGGGQRGWVYRAYIKCPGD